MSGTLFSIKQKRIKILVILKSVSRLTIKYFRSSVNIFTGNSTQNFPNQYLFLEEEKHIHETNSTWFTFGFRQAGRRRSVV